MKTEKTVTAIITDYIRPEKLGAYKQWRNRIHETVAAAPGFIEIEPVTPSADRPNEYSVVIRFARLRDLKQWERSDTYAAYLEELKAIAERPPVRQYVEGLEVLFDKKIPYLKQVVLSTLCVYPLILLIVSLVGMVPLFADLSFPVSTLISTIPISMLMVWPALPIARRLLQKWLYA